MAATAVTATEIETATSKHNAEERWRQQRLGDGDGGSNGYGDGDGSVDGEGDGDCYGDCVMAMAMTVLWW